MSSKWDELGRICSVCSLYQVWDCFSSKNSKRYKHRVDAKLHQLKQPKCKSCAIKELTKWKTSKSVDWHKNRHYERHYNLTLQEVEQFLVAQDYKCLLCTTEIINSGSSGNRAVVDHCHIKGHVRGILCNECNRGLGYFKDNIETLKRAIQYLKEKG